MQAIADDMGKPIAQVALNWLRQKQDVTSIINGVSSLAQLEKNIEATQWDISEADMARLDAAIAEFEDM